MGISGHTIVRETRTFTPSSLDDVNSVYVSYTNLNNAFDNGSANNYANFYWVKGAGAETLVYLNFDTSAIPSNATIIEVSGKARINMTGYQSGRWSSRGTCLCSGTTRKSSTLYSNSLASFSDAGTWTVAELRDAKLLYYVTRGSTAPNEDYYLYVFGGSITVTYEYEI